MTMRFQHRFVVHAPIEDVAAFHTQTRNMGAITPPPIIVRVQDAPPVMGEGDEMRFTLWLGPLPVRWAARFEDMGPDGFTDHQIEGPFALWAHRHAYIPLSGGRTEVRDTVVASLDRNPINAAVGAAMWAGMRSLFAYRARRTKEILGRR